MLGGGDESISAAGRLIAGRLVYDQPADVGCLERHGSSGIRTSYDAAGASDLLYSAYRFCHFERGLDASQSLPPCRAAFALLLALTLLPEGMVLSALGPLAAAPVAAEDATVLLTTGWTTSVADGTTSVAWGDVDGDGDLALTASNDGPNRVYRNENGVLNPTAAWSSSEVDKTWSMAWGDVDLDLDLDLAAGNKRK